MRPGSPKTVTLGLLAATAVFLMLNGSPATAKRAKHVKEKSITAPTARTPTDETDCIALSQAFYGHAKTLARRTKQSIPREFMRVVTNLDEFCGEEDFEKARISIDWMDTCFKNFTKDYESGACSRSKSYFCAIDPASDGCLASQ
jgi:hypothetical protein